MYYNNSLEKVFSNPSKIKILRFLARYKSDLTGRELSRFTGISHTQVQEAIRELYAERLVLSRRAGRSVMHRINGKNEFVKNVLTGLFEAESALLNNILRKYLGPVFRYCVSAALFGSVNSRTERPDSDVDIFILTENASKKKIIEKELEKINIDFIEATGNVLSCMVMSLDEYLKYKKQRKAVLAEIEKGSLLFGKRLDVVLKEAA